MASRRTIRQVVRELLPLADPDSWAGFSSVTMACPNPGELAAFYAALIGGEVTFVHEAEWATMRSGGLKLEFMGVANYRPPQWPDDPSLMHIDFHVDDLDDAAAHAEAVGGRRFEHQPNAAQSRTS